MHARDRGCKTNWTNCARLTDDFKIMDLFVTKNVVHCWAIVLWPSINFFSCVYEIAACTESALTADTICSFSLLRATRCRLLLLLLLLFFDSNVWFALYFLSHIDTKHNTRYNDNVRLISQNSLNSRVLHMPSIFTHSRLAYTHTHTPCSFRPFLPHSYPVSFLFAFQLFNSLTLIYVPSRKNH